MRILFHFLGYLMCGSVTIGSSLSSGGLSLIPFSLLFYFWISTSLNIILIYSLFSIMEGFIVGSFPLSKIASRIQVMEHGLEEDTCLFVPHPFEGVNVF